MQFSKFQNAKDLLNLSYQWKLIRFNELLEDVTKNGQKIPGSEYEESGLYPIIDQGKDLIAGFSNLENPIKGEKIVFGDHTRVLKYIDFEGFHIGADGVKVLENKIPDKVLSKYIYYYLSSVKIPNTGYNRHFKYLKEVVIPVPNLEIQLKLVELFDEVNSLIIKRQSQITALDELTKSLFLEMFGDPISNNRKWDISSFDEFALIDTKMTNDFESHKKEYHVGIDSIQKNSGRLINLKEVGESNLTSGKYIFNSEHIIYSKIRPYLNKVALPNFSGLCSADAYPLLPKKNKSTRHFLAYLLRSDAFLNHVSQNSDRTNIPKVNKKQLQSFQGILPPINLQIEFEEKIKLIEKKREMLTEALEKMNYLYNSLLQQAFKGELFQEQ